MIAVGTAGLLWLPGLYAGEGLGFVDALFTATSAVCVTGLIVVDTATYFTPLGQAWVLALVQAGGLGILVFTTLALAVLGRRGSLGLEEATGGHASILNHVQTAGLVRSIVLVTFGAEAVGALGLWLLWAGDMGFVGALGPATFHAVSAFCNAGFSTFSDSLAGFREAPLTLSVVGGLVIVGGLGFVVLEDLKARFVDRRVDRLSVHTRIVLWTSGGLLAVGFVLFAAFEWVHQLRGLGMVDRLANAAFMSITPRTAGFNSVDYGGVTNASVLLTILFMLVGGSPGSTAGGLKTVTIALVALLLLSRLHGRRHLLVFDRTIPRETVWRAVGLVVGGLALMTSALFAVTISQGGPAGVTDRTDFVRDTFEAVSAFATVGLSMGITGDLTAASRVVLTVLMFVGRVGPAVAVTAMASALHRRRLDLRYGEEDVLIG